MSKRILFRGFESTKRAPGLGDIFDYCQICYLKGKEFGFDDIHIVFPRWGPFNHEGWGISEEDFNWQPTKFLPWKWYPRNKAINIEEWDKVVNTLESNSLYEGYNGINTGFYHTSQYLSMYYKEKKLFPYIDVKRDSKEDYILFQYRTNFSDMAYHSETRTTLLSDFQFVFNTIKEFLGDKYSYYQIGNTCSISDQFDKVIPNMYGDLDNLAKLICNSSLMVASHSGIANISFIMPGLPIIIQSLVAEVWYNGKLAVDGHPNWCDGKVLIFKKGKPINKKLILDFLKKHNLYD